MLLQLELEGEKVLSRNFRVFGDSIKEMKAEFKEIGDLIVDSSLENFENGGSESGGKWKPLAPSTVRARSKRSGYYKKAPTSGASGSGPVLVWTGNLKRSFKAQSKDFEVTVTNSAPYFKYHQAAIRQGRKLPRRLILELKQQTKLGINNIIAKGLNKRLNSNFGKQF